MIAEPDFKQIAENLYKPFRQVASALRVVSILRPIAMVLALLWLAFCAFGTFSYDSMVYQWLNSHWWFILGPFAVMSVVIMFSNSRQLSLLKKEHALIQQAVSSLVPGARYQSVLLRQIAQATAAGRTEMPKRWGTTLPEYTCYGMLTIPCGDAHITIADIGIIKNRTAMAMSNPVTGYFALLWKIFIKPLMGARAESALTDFRGMFVYIPTPSKLRGRVSIVPDHLERKVGYLARTIQELKNNADLRLVYMEDVEFENLFAVYADDEVYARRILTPAMMRRMTVLRQRRQQDLSMAFEDGEFSFSMEKPEGLFTVSRSVADGEVFLRSLYKEVCFFQEVLSDLKIETEK